eukprot:TRINITY_DN1068_c0_g1_i5.p2 TRINITY_DN1068_c0_g1~~TRINITY_DN1068_c0_g1_i5.p2  ORF type:complete len:174 (+),score=55.06 TRINITY_DN1068_c0_g1_i5:232-753(+)
MLVYKCIVTDSEITTDADNDDAEFLWGNTWKKVPGKYRTIGGDDFELEGANASAEEVAEDGSAETEQVIDKVHDFRLQPMEYTKKEYMSYAKGFLKKCIMHLKENDRADEVADFKSNIQESLKAITAEWNEYCCYVDEDYNCEGATVLCRYEGADGATPHFYYLMAGFKETKY